MRGKLCYMRKKILNLYKALIICLILFSPFFSFSQDTVSKPGRFFNDWSVNLNAGTTLFFGDINEYLISRYQSEWQLAYGIMLSKQITSVLGIRGQLLNGKISGAKMKFKNGSPANLQFNADFFEYNLNATINFNHLFLPQNQHNLFSVYGFIGMGMSNWTTELRNIRTNTIVAGNGQKGKGLKKLTNEGMIPAGLGIDIHFNRKWNLTMESGFRVVNSDKLDAAIGGFKYDMYNYSSLGITYIFSPSVSPIKAPKTDITILEFAQEKPILLSLPPLKIKCELPKQILPGSLFDVRINILKNKMEGPGEIHLNVPKDISWTGYCNTKASLDSKNQIITIKWDKLPSDTMLLILLTLKPDTTLNGDIEISGKFFYKSDNFDKIEPFSSIVSIKENQPKEVSKVSPASKTDSTTINRKVKLVDLKKKIAAEKTSVNKSGVEYQIQIYAERKKMTSTEALARKFNIHEPIREDSYNGFNTYSIGSYTSNNEAVKQMKKIRLQNDVHDAFVVKFKNGKRITP